MRTVKEAYYEIKALDPNTSITEWFIRCLCHDGKVKHFKAGKGKILLDLDALRYYLSTGDENYKGGFDTWEH